MIPLILKVSVKEATQPPSDAPSPKGCEEGILAIAGNIADEALYLVGSVFDAIAGREGLRHAKGPVSEEHFN